MIIITHIIIKSVYRHPSINLNDFNNYPNKLCDKVSKEQKSIFFFDIFM